MIAPAEQQVSALQARYLPELKARMRAAIPDSPSGFFGLLRYHLGWEDVNGNPADEDAGKALRPVLCLMACELTGGNWRAALPAAAALELVHNFSLIHDDIQDGDTTRRGRPTLWSVRGIPAALAAGNAMRTIADTTLAMLTSSGLPASIAATACVELTRRYLEMIEGQYLDMSFEQDDTVSVDQYLDMVSRKTGALIESAMFLGALVGLRDPEQARALGQCGRKLGVAFQVRDDYLGVWGDTAATGKAVGADIRRKKKSFPMIYMLQHTGPEDRPWVVEALAAPEVTPENVERLLAFMERIGAREAAQRTAEALAAEALEPLQGVQLAPDAHGKLEAMAEFFISRER